MRTNLILVFVLGIMLGLALAGTVTISTSQTPAAQVKSPFVYSFNSAGTLKEASSMNESTSPYWWLNSGGELWLNGSTGSTMLGLVSTSNIWNKLYAESSSLDTDNGTHPQNLFRLVTRSQWENAREEAQFMVLKDNFSDSQNRNASNGLLLMSRYKNADTLYYAGVRVDGSAVIKKKYKGTYYTMGQKTIFPGTYSGSQDEKNLIPHNEWIGLRNETVTNQDGSVTVRLFMKRASVTTWQKLLEVKDTGQYGGSAPIVGAGYAGVRTDFMDVKFDSYRLEKI